MLRARVAKPTTVTVLRAFWRQLLKGVVVLALAGAAVGVGRTLVPADGASVEGFLVHAGSRG